MLAILSIKMRRYLCFVLLLRYDQSDRGSSSPSADRKRNKDKKKKKHRSRSPSERKKKHYDSDSESSDTEDRYRGNTSRSSHFNQKHDDKMQEEIRFVIFPPS